MSSAVQEHHYADDQTRPPVLLTYSSCSRWFRNSKAYILTCNIVRVKHFNNKIDIRLISSLSPRNVPDSHCVESCGALRSRAPPLHINIQQTSLQLLPTTTSDMILFQGLEEVLLMSCLITSNFCLVCLKNYHSSILTINKVSPHT